VESRLLVEEKDNPEIETERVMAEKEDNPEDLENLENLENKHFSSIT
jgi:hypothetical protein